VVGAQEKGKRECGVGEGGTGHGGWGMGCFVSLSGRPGADKEHAWSDMLAIREIAFLAQI
jgi:hypothetical protein